MRTINMPPDDRQPDDDRSVGDNGRPSGNNQPAGEGGFAPTASYPETKYPPSIPDLQDLGEALSGDGDPFLTASYNHLATLTALVETFRGLSPEQTLIEQQDTLQHTASIITPFYTPNVQQLTKEYAKRLQPSSLKAELDPNFLSCLTDIVKEDTDRILEVARDIAPHVFLPNATRTQLEISQSIKDMYADIVDQYGEQDAKGEILDIFCRDFAKDLADIQVNFVQKAFQSIPAVDARPAGVMGMPDMPTDTLASPEPVYQEYPLMSPDTELQSPRSAWPQKLGDAALQALSIAAGVAAGATLSAAFRKKFGL